MELSTKPFVRELLVRNLTTSHVVNLHSFDGSIVFRRKFCGSRRLVAPGKIVSRNLFERATNHQGYKTNETHSICYDLLVQKNLLGFVVLTYRQAELQMTSRHTWMTQKCTMDVWTYISVLLYCILPADKGWKLSLLYRICQLTFTTKKFQLAEWGVDEQKMAWNGFHQGLLVLDKT